MRLNRPLVSIIVLLVPLGLGACQPLPIQTTVTPTPHPTGCTSDDEAISLLEAFAAAIRSDDASAAAELFLEDGELTHDGDPMFDPSTGKFQATHNHFHWKGVLIRGEIQHAMIGSDTDYIIGHAEVEGNTVTTQGRITSSWFQRVLDLPLAELGMTLTATIQNCKIAHLNFSYTEEALQELTEAHEETLGEFGEDVATTAQPATAITAEDLIGLWKVQFVEHYIQFNEDGTYKTGPFRRRLEDTPAQLGVFQLEGTLLTFFVSDESAVCPGENASLKVELTEQGQLQLKLRADSCAALPESMIWDRVAP